MAAESTLERRIKRYAEDKNCLFWKLSANGVKGLPDRILVTPNGVVAFIEIKAPKEKPRAIQLYRMQQLREKGVPATYVDNFDSAKDFITGMLNPKL